MSCWKHSLFGLFCLLATLVQFGEASQKQPPAAQPDTKAAKDAAVVKDVTQGALRIVGEDATIVECPLKHTDVKADVAGFIAEVHVTQTFHNPTEQPIEAVYVFPLPHGSAVHEMTMAVGQRRIVGLIKRRAAARAIYEQAIMSGQTAALLEQERPNIFTQTVGNIPPGEVINIEISYIDVLDYDMGNYEFHFPMVVGPRYNPGRPISAPAPRDPALSKKVSPPEVNTTEVPDATRINPPVLKPKFRTGHDIALSLSLDAGVPIQNLSVANHRADINKQGRRRAAVKLAKNDSLPNKDFVLRYNVSGKKPEMAVLAHTGEHSGDARRLGNGYFMLMIQPQEDERLTKSPPREMVFMVDVSGSMRGQPTAKTIETMQTMLGLCRPIDTVQVITFAGQAKKLFNEAVPVDEASIKTALNFTAGLQGRGGTEMLKGIKLAIDEPIDHKRMRIVVMLTDGYIGNEAQIIEHVGKNCGDQIRFWAIGMGTSPNMFLIDGVARQGGGMGKRLGLQDDSESLSHEVMTRIQRAQLADVKIDWGDLQVGETYTARIPELWAGRPVILFGRYTEGGSGRISVSGRVEGEDVSWPLEVNLGQDEPRHGSLAKVWARKKIEDLMQQTFYAGSPAVEEEVTAIALDYRLMSQYTSFVAVDADKLDETIEPARRPRRMAVPVPLPDGTSWEGFFGESSDEELDALSAIQFSRKTKTAAPAPVALGGFLPGRSQPFQLMKKVPAPTAGRRLSSDRQIALSTSESRQVSLYRSRSLSQFGRGRESWGFRGGSAGGGGFAGKSLEKLSLAEDLVAQDEETPNDAWRYLPRLAVEEAKPVGEAALKAFDAATKLEKDGSFAEARVALMRAFLLDSAVFNGVQAGGQISADAVSALERVHAGQVKAWTAKNPTLGKKLDLVIRDKSVAEALAIVSAAAGIEIELLDGSTADAAKMTRKSARVNYLDLRRATVAQALDWILHPQRMSWQSKQGTVIAGTDRRQAGTSTWVYDVTLLLPSSKELKDAGNESTKVAAKAAKTLVTSLRSKLSVDDPISIIWFGPGHLLVVGDVDRHAAVDTWMDDQFRAKPASVAADLKAIAEKSVAAQRRASVGSIHASSAWKLLAAAAGGELDLEALTELQIAWRSKQTDELLDGASAALVMRSLWCVTEAARALPEEAELKALATAARAKSRAATTAALEALDKNRDDVSAFSALLYASLAMRDDPELTSKAALLLTESSAADSQLEPARTLARILLASPTDADIEAMLKLVESGVAGQDMTALLAIACHRAGSEAWTAFRREANDLLGNQPLAGSVLVLINRLNASQLEVAFAVK